MIALLEALLIVATVSSVTMSVLAVTRAARRRDNQVQMVGDHSTAIQSGSSISIQASHGSVASWFMGNVNVGTQADDTAPSEPHPITAFTAVCDCPGCGYTDAHYLRGANPDEAPATTQRTCTQCGEIWGQI